MRLRPRGGSHLECNKWGRREHAQRHRCRQWVIPTGSAVPSRSAPSLQASTCRGGKDHYTVATTATGPSCRQAGRGTRPGPAGRALTHTLLRTDLMPSLSFAPVHTLSHASHSPTGGALYAEPRSSVRWGLGRAQHRHIRAAQAVFGPDHMEQFRTFRSNFWVAALEMLQGDPTLRGVEPPPMWP